MKLGFACKYFDAQQHQPFPFRATTRKRFLSLGNEERIKLSMKFPPLILIICI